MRNQSSKPKPVQTDWQQKKELQQPPNKSEFQTLTKLLQTLQPSKKNIMQSSSLLRTQAKTHTQKKKSHNRTELCCKVHSRNQIPTQQQQQHQQQ
jgi:hypothetical protein